jgi:integral membrane protein (TIGR00529 family)
MTMLTDIPAIIKVIFVFILVLFLIRKKISLGNAFVIGALTMSLLFGFKPGLIINSAYKSVTYPKTYLLAVIVSLILILSSSMEKSGQMQRLLENFKGLLSKTRLNLVLFPALIGLLPMPGGAVFSAPMVKELGSQSDFHPDKLSFTNYWFRHIWEFCWPLYPGILLAAVITDLNLFILVATMVPVTILAASLGFWTLKDLNRSGNKNSHIITGKAAWPFVSELIPILIVVILGFLLGIILSILFPTLLVSKELGLILALCTAIGWVWHKNQTVWKQQWQLISNRQIWNMMYVVMSILIFKGILEDSNAVSMISNDLIKLKIPMLLVAVILPLFVGLITGLTIAVMGISFPILIPLVHSIGDATMLLPYVMVVMVSGFAGVLLSPLHLCLILSNEYFNVSMGSVYRHMWALCVIIIGSCLAYFIGIHWILNII